MNEHGKLRAKQKRAILKVLNTWFIETDADIENAADDILDVFYPEDKPEKKRWRPYQYAGYDYDADGQMIGLSPSPSFPTPPNPTSQEDT